MRDINQTTFTEKHIQMEQNEKPINMSGLNMREKIERWTVLQGTFLLRISIGFIYCLFGILKFSPNLSPAEDLATTTVQTLTFGLLSPEFSMILLALWETAIGFLLLLNILRPLTLVLVLLHIAGTFTPLLFFPELTFTLVGQYILKNIIIVSAMLVLSTSALKEKHEERESY
ncbi:doxx family protein [Salegentibacter sp. JZCK2]|uniref:DoxX family membrane protein n=1 Tax=Salegentibacter tibetensis TaxID=2873600 RepID=UPI001CCDCB6E|nr:DoxX family membrane protein [Salegentibacter tibetensis]MBZ9731375.1 doxx family protein [Salegentibacter tibetensis]